MNQAERILRFIREHPGCTVMDIQLGCEPFVANPRGRISDLRAKGHDVVCRRRSDSRDGYWLVDQAQIELGLAS